MMNFSLKTFYLALIFAGLCGHLACAQSPAGVSPATALHHYLHNGDPSFKWELRDSSTIGSAKLYQVLLTSQKWREYTWRHQLTVIVPATIQYDGAMLFITGGSNQAEQPNWTKGDQLWPPLAGLADKNKAIIAILRQTPNQPLYGDLTEDALISHTLHQFKKDKDYSWPLLFPMVKSAVRAMDAVQAFGQNKLKRSVNHFLITGASKRGWTTWLSAAIDDKRVKAIAPMVIDMLNMPATLNYQFKSYGEYSVQIEDYVKLGIPQGTDTEDGKAITRMIDPYAYRSSLTVPKMIFIGTNDEYWTVDAIKHYYAQIPGKNLIHYVPNVGHNLGGGKQAFEALGAFFGATLQNREYPLPNWKVNSSSAGVELEVNAVPTDLVDATLWYTTSADLDFRNNLWLSKSIKTSTPSLFKASLPFPKKGYQAFYLDLRYKDPNGGLYTTSTRIYLTDQEKVLD